MSSIPQFLSFSFFSFLFSYKLLRITLYPQKIRLMIFEFDRKHTSQTRQTYLHWPSIESSHWRTAHCAGRGQVGRSEFADSADGWKNKSCFWTHLEYNALPNGNPWSADNNSCSLYIDILLLSAIQLLTAMSKKRKHIRNWLFSNNEI